MQQVPMCKWEFLLIQDFERKISISKREKFANFLYTQYNWNSQNRDMKALKSLSLSFLQWA